MAVVFSMMTSYFLSRTLVPTMVQYLLGAEVHLDGEAQRHRSIIERVHDAFNRQFDKLVRLYGGWLAWSLDHRWSVFVIFTLFVGASSLLFPHIGQDFFQRSMPDKFAFTSRAPAGTSVGRNGAVFRKGRSDRA